MPRNRRYCSRLCSKRASDERLKAAVGSVPRTCRHCGKDISDRAPQTRFCNRECSRKARPKCTFYGCILPIDYDELCRTHIAQREAGKELTPIKYARDVGAVLARDRLGRKECPTCETWKPIGEFGRYAKTADGLASRCKVCQATNHRRVTYSMTAERYEQMLADQGGLCALCKDPPGKRALSIDHDHRCCPGRSRSCGKCIRALLCGKCNVAIGLMRDNAELLRAAADYVTTFECARELELAAQGAV